MDATPRHLGDTLPQFGIERNRRIVIERVIREFKTRGAQGASPEEGGLATALER